MLRTDRERPALENIDQEFPVPVLIDRELHVDGILVYRLDKLQEFTHRLHQFFSCDQALAGNEKHLPPHSPLPQSVLGVPVMGKERILQIAGKKSPQLIRISALENTFFRVNDIDHSL